MRSIWNVQYMQRVLATDPIIYWMQDEKQGAVSYDMVTARSNGARNGTYTGVTLGQPGIGDGRTCPLFDGANDFNNVLTAALVAAFNGDEGSFMIWAKVFNAGVWTDGVERRPYTFLVNGTNYVLLTKSAANNRIVSIYAAGGVVEAGARDPYNNTDWFNWLITWSKSADEVNYYLDGALFETDTVLGNWAGNLTIATIGSGSTVPTHPWHGWLAHSAVWDRALLPAAVAALAVV